MCYARHSHRLIKANALTLKRRSRWQLIEEFDDAECRKMLYSSVVAEAASKLLAARHAPHAHKM